jgi:predicted ArsR family transcriptional regulator
MTTKNSQSKVRKTIAWSLRHVNKMTYREVGMSLGISTERARQLIKQCEAIDLRWRTQDVCLVFSVNTHIEALGRKFVDEALALCESLNGVSK